MQAGADFYTRPVKIFERPVLTGRSSSVYRLFPLETAFTIGHTPPVIDEARHIDFVVWTVSVIKMLVDPDGR